NPNVIELPTEATFDVMPNRAAAVTRPPSGLCCREYFAHAALAVAGKQRRDVLAHPGPTDLARDTSRIFRGGEREDEDEVRVLDPCDLGREAAASTTSCTTS